MKDLKNWAIAILGIVCLGLVWSNKHKDAQIETLKQCSVYEVADYNHYVEATEALINEVCDYVEDKYGEYLPDTIWEGDIYDEYAVAYQQITIDYD